MSLKNVLKPIDFTSDNTFFSQNTLKNQFLSVILYYFHSKYTQKLILSVILYYFHSKYTQKYLLCVILCGFHYKYTQNRPIFGLFFTINALKIAFWAIFGSFSCVIPVFHSKYTQNWCFLRFLCDFHSKYTQKH